MAPARALVPALLRDRSFLLFFCARSVSMAGYVITGVAMPVLMLGLTDSARLTALISAVEVLPYLVFGLLAGALADRMNRKKIMLICYLVSAVAVASVPVSQATGTLTAGQLLVVAAVTATCFVWFDAASFGALPALVGRARLVEANSLLFVSSTLIDISFPAIAGALIVTVGLALAMGADAASYLIAVLLLWVVPAGFGLARSGDGPAGSAAAMLRRTVADIRAGLDFLWHQDLLRSLTLLGFGNSFTGGAVSALIVVYGVRHLGLSNADWRLSLLYSAAAVGALVASLLLPRLNRRWPVGWITIAALTVNPMLLLGLTLVPGIVLAVLLYALWAAAWVLVNVNGISARQLVTPDELQGRVNTTARMIAWGGTPFGALTAGIVADGWSIEIAYLAMALVGLLTATLAWASPLRRRELVLLSPAD